MVQFRRSTAILTLAAASIGGGLIAALAVAMHEKAPVVSVARADTANQKVSSLSASFADMVEKASPAVVRISSTRIVKASDQERNNPMMQDPFFQRFFGGQNGRGQNRDQRERGLGSGVIISGDGYILTNNHVIDKASSLKVELSDGRTFTGKAIGADPQTDVAVVKITSSGLPTLSFANSDSARVGDLVFAIGNPFGNRVGGEASTVTMGIISAKGRALEHNTSLQSFIQTDAAINPGNSGGALINSHGDMIGMNTAILSGGSALGGEGGNIGIGFAVPSNMAKSVADQLMKTGKVSRGYMGVTLGNVTPESAPLLGLKEAKGATVNDVTPKAPGAAAGLQSGDVITAIDGKPVVSSDDLTMNVIAHKPGDVVTLDVVRNNNPTKVKVTLGQRPTGTDWDASGKKPGNDDDGNNDEGGNSGAVTSRGISVEPLTPETAQQIGVEPTTKGVVISDIDQSSPAADATLARGIVITAVNRKPVTSTADFKRLMGAEQGKAVLLTVNLQGRTAFIPVQPQ